MLGMMLLIFAEKAINPVFMVSIFYEMKENHFYNKLVVVTSS